MTTTRRLLLLVLVLTLAAGVSIYAQANGTATEEPNPNANISWPPPVYLVRGEFEIRGSASLPNMTNYFIQLRSIDETFGSDEPVATVEPGTEVEDEGFFPVILPSSAPVIDDVLGVWDTTIWPDGLYEIRLTVNTSAGEPIVYTVSPLRVENEPPPFVQIPEDQPTLVAPPTVAAATEVPPPTQVPTDDPTPRVTVATPNGNVRSGDSTDYQIVASLTQGQTAVIVGISNTGSGWYQVRLENGQLGWMAPSIVTTSGNLNGLPRVQPPPPPATPTFTPVPATPTPATQANLVAGNPNPNPGTPVCGQVTTYTFDVANLGTQANATTGTITVVDVHVASGTQTTTVGAVPIVQPGQTIGLPIPLTVSVFYNELHRVTFTIDSGNQIAETTKADNTRTFEYTLAQGSC